MLLEKINLEEMSQNDLEKMLVDLAEKYLKDNFSYRYDKTFDSFKFEVYLGYDDVIETDTLLQLLKEYDNDLDLIRDYIFELYIESISDEETWVVEQIGNHLRDNGYEDLIEYYEEKFHGDLRELFLFNHSLFYVHLDIDYILNATVPVNIMLENDVAFDHEFNMNSFETPYTDLLEYFKNVKEEIESGYLKEEDYSFINLLKSQGYTFDEYISYCEYQLIDEIKDCKHKDSEFMSSLLSEMLNTTSECNSLTVLREMSFNELQELKEQEEIEIKINDTIGYVDHVVGAGSMINIKLEKPFKVKTKNISLMIDGEYGYGITEIYGYIHG